MLKNIFFFKYLLALLSGLYLKKIWLKKDNIII